MTLTNTLEDFKHLKRDNNELREEINNIKGIKHKLENEKLQILNREDKYIEEINDRTSNLRNLKTDLKSELNEKIAILKELENLKTSQKQVQDNHMNLKNIIENNNKELQQANLKIKHMTKEKEDLTKHNIDLSAELKLLFKQNEELKEKYKVNFYELEKIDNEYKNVKNELDERKFNEINVFKLRDKYEEDQLIIKSDLNLWKHAFIEVAKYKLISYNNAKLEQLISLDKNHLASVSKSSKEKVESIISYFKSLIDEDNNKSSNVYSLKEAYNQEQEKNFILKELLLSEKVLRRKIHNRYMSLRGNLRVMCRVRPFLDDEKNITKQQFVDSYSISNSQISVTDLSDINKMTKKYNLDYVFQQNSTQSDVYDEVSLLVQNMLTGTNVCIIAYGQTCTGKTFTIQGPNNEYPGIALKSAKEIFEMINPLLIQSSKSNKTHTKLSISIIEFYNDVVYNLLGDDMPQLNMYENNGNLIIPDLHPISVNNYHEANKLFKLASKLRQTGHTSSNDQSSRSHCIYSFYLKIVEEDGTIIRSKLHLIDLAGSERFSKSHETNPLVKKEGKHINLSLNALSNVLNAIALKQNHIPYRESKLTHFLKESLNDSFNILLLLHISPNIKDICETNSTLEFGTRIAKLCKHKTGKEKKQGKSDKYLSI